MLTSMRGMTYCHDKRNYDYLGQDQVRDYCRTVKLKSYLLKEYKKSWKDDRTVILSYIKWTQLIKDYWLHWSALGFGKETKAGYICKSIDNECASACASHLVQI